MAGGKVNEHGEPFVNQLLLASPESSGWQSFMIVQHFLKWIDTAKESERAAAANALARAYIVSEMSFEDRCAAEAALTLLLDDPSPKVRQAMYEALAEYGVRVGQAAPNEGEAS